MFGLRWMSALFLICGLVLPLQLSAGENREQVLFPFDDHSLPFSKELLLNLVAGRKGTVNQGTGADALHPDRPVVPPGKPGDPDHPRAYYYGTVLHIDGEYRMWYTG